MNLVDLARKTALIGLTLAVASTAHASVFGGFEGTVTNIFAGKNTTIGDLAGDLAADPSFDLGLGTLFTGDFVYKTQFPDENPSPTIGFYSDPLFGFSINGGDISETSSTGQIRIKNDDPQGSNFRDEFRLTLFSNGPLSNSFYTINGNLWKINFIELEMRETSNTAPTILSSDSLPNPLPDFTNWEDVRIRIRIRPDGVQGAGNHFIDIGARNVTGDPTVFTDAPEPATMALFGLGLTGLGLVKRRRD